MTNSDLRALLDDATRDVPFEIQQAPLAAIHGRVRGRRRARLAALALTAVALTGGALVPAVVLRDRPAPPATAAARIAWEFALVDGAAMTIYPAQLAPCTVLDDAVADIGREAAGISIVLTGTPRRADDCARADLPSLKVTLDRPIGDEVLRDGVTGEVRPLYHRADLPVGSVDDGWVGFSWGVVRSNRGVPKFEGRYFRLDRNDLLVDALGLASDPSPAAGMPWPRPGERMRFGSVEGHLLQINDKFVFAWNSKRAAGPQGTAHYEITSAFQVGQSREEFLGLLSSLSWP